MRRLEGLVARRGAAAIAASLAGALLLAGGASGEGLAAPATGSYAGTVPGTRAFVSVVVGKNRDVLAYVSDGRKLAVWARGRTAAPTFTLRAGNTHLRVRLTGERASGTVRLGGKQRPFTATRARKPAGLYRARRTVRGKRYVGGWIVLPDGRQRGAVRVGSRTLAAPLTHPAAAGGVRVAGVRLAPGLVSPTGKL